ncbi:mitochondrial 54S ribosomal protein uL10m SCDLUD_001919 [Saccharomycodes ludwigii]|nr:hypothetical protein SCDLUD_001919 [Saccharomycodes ludwigii]KAH3902106.1 hypothetical protein SCDLUD_001919 [Saccharomycodes ludwigii]
MSFVFQFCKYSTTTNTITAQRLTIKPLLSRKTLLVDTYKDLMDKSPLVLFAHYNNLNKTENKLFRDLIQKNNGKLTVLRNNLFKVYLKNSKFEDPCFKGNDKKKIFKNHPLLPLFKGPTCAISFTEVEPANVKALFTALKKHNDKLFIIGARLDNNEQVLDLDKLNEFKELPNKSALQQQLLGLLHILSGAGLVNTLEMAGTKNLYLTLKSHENHIKKSEEPETKKEE